MPNIDRQSRCTCTLPTPTPSPFNQNQYVSPTCELNDEEIELYIKILEIYWKEEIVGTGLDESGEDAIFLTDDQIDELEQCEGKFTNAQKRRIGKLGKDVIKWFTALSDSMLISVYGIAAYTYDLFANENSRFLGPEELADPNSPIFDEAQPGLRVIKEELKETYNENKIPGFDSWDDYISSLKQSKDEDAEKLPNSVTNFIDSWIDNGKVSLVDKLRVSVSPTAKNIFESVFGIDPGFAIDSRDIEKLNENHPFIKEISEEIYAIDLEVQETYQELQMELKF